MSFVRKLEHRVDKMAAPPCYDRNAQECSHVALKVIRVCSSRVVCAFLACFLRKIYLPLRVVVARSSVDVLQTLVLVVRLTN